MEISVIRLKTHVKRINITKVEEVKKPPTAANGTFLTKWMVAHILTCPAMIFVLFK
jgi:hypothetical protein